MGTALQNFKLLAEEFGQNLAAQEREQAALITGAADIMRRAQAQRRSAMEEVQTLQRRAAELVAESLRKQEEADRAFEKSAREAEQLLSDIAADKASDAKGITMAIAGPTETQS